MTGEEPPLVLHKCETIMTAGVWTERNRCGRPGTPWTAPSGATYIVCDEHRAGFESGQTGGNEEET